MTAALQCKWRYDGDLVALGSRLRHQLQQRWGADARAYVATLYHEHDGSTLKDGVTVWGRRQIAELLIRHREACAIARTLGVASKDAASS